MSAPVTLIAVVGPTAVGKTALAIQLVQRFGGEIVNADSRQVYIGMDIGTAKPTADERRSALHHLIDIRKPDTPLSLGEYLPLARDCVTDIAGRGKLPILCGGTGQYVWAMLEGWDVPAIPPDADFRARLEQRAAADGTRALWNELNVVDPQRAVAIGPHNLRRIIRALEILHSTGEQVSAARRSSEPPFRAFIIGLTAERASLYRRIDERFDLMMSQGLLDEARRLAAACYELGRGPLSGVGYTQLGQYLAGEITLNEAVARSKSQTHRLVRRQYAWFKPSDRRIEWLDATHELPIAETTRRVERFLAS